MASIPSDHPLAEIGTFSDVPVAPTFTLSPWADERFVSHAEPWFLIVTGPEILARLGRPASRVPRAHEWSLEVTFDLFPPAPEGHWQDVGPLARQIGTVHVLSMITGRQRWVAWRPAQPYPYWERIFDRDGQLLSQDVRGVPLDLSQQEWNALYDGIRLLDLAEQRGPGRPKGSRTGLDHATWQMKAQQLRTQVRDKHVAMPGAIARLELGITPETGWDWIRDLDQEMPAS